jgi:hypothetical protein
MSKQIIKVDGFPVGVERGPRNLWRITVNNKVTGVQTDNPKQALEYARRSAKKLIEDSRKER